MARELDPTIQLLKSRIDQGASVEDIYNALFQTPTQTSQDEVKRTALSRCVLVHSFDAKLYQSLVTTIPGAPSFTALSSDAALEVIQANPLAYSIKPSERFRFWQAWLDNRTELNNLCINLIPRIKGELSPNDELGLLVFADPAAALDRFRTAYQAADAEFDLAQCDALVRVLETRYDLIDSNLQKACRDYRIHQRRRALFADEYYRSVFYLNRQRLFKKFDDFLKDPSHWLLLISGAGGMGKTHFQRWTIARGLLSEKETTLPIARLDCDFLNLPVLERFPWLVFPRLARQFALQTADAGFDKFVDEFDDADRVLQRGYLEAEHLVSLLGDIEARKDELSSKDDYFISLAGSKPLLVIIDTIEEALLHNRKALMELIGRLAKVQRGAPGFRVVLSGRYSPTEKVDTFAAQYKGQYDLLEVGPFDEEESSDYLRNVRGLPESAPVKAIYEKTLGNPFGLALYADLVLADKSMDAAKIASYPRVEFAYLIDRIIERIPDSQRAVRWLLRYAVVPRLLTKAFTADVLAKPLGSEMSRPRRDKPNEFKGEVRSYQGREIWKGSETVDLDRVWSDLCSYASSNSWISEKDGVVRLQPEVVTPMRRLLRQQSAALWKSLHKSAATYYEKRSRMKDAAWEENIIEAIYHHFQANGSSAEGFWRESMEDSRANAPSIQKQLASVLLSGEFLDADNRPIEYFKHEPVVNFSTIYEARLAVAFATLLQILMLDEDHSDVNVLQNDLKSQLKEMQALKRKPERGIRRRLQLLEAFLDIDRSRDHAVKELERLLEQEDESVYRLAASMLLARLTQKDRFWKAAVSIVRTLPAPVIAASWVHYQRGLNFKRAGDLKEACESLLKAARASFSEPFPPAYSSRLLRETVELCIESGLWTDLEKLVDRPERDYEEGIVLKLARGLLAERRLSPNEALQHATVATDTTARFIQAQAFLLQARTLGSLLQQRQAEERWEEARERFQGLGQQAGIFSCLSNRAQFYRVSLGNFHHAAQVMADLRTQITNPHQEFEHCLEDIRRAAQVNTSDSRSLWDHLASNTSSFGPREHVRIQVLGLALGFIDKADELIEQLKIVDPVESRYTLLEDFDLYSGVAVRRGKKATAALLTAVPVPEPSSLYVAARIVPLANALRAFGEGSEAMKILRPVALELSRYPYARRAVENVMLQIDPRCLNNRDEQLARFEEEFGNASTLFGNARALCGAYRVEEAERLWRTGQLNAAREMAEKAQESLLPQSIWEIRALRVLARIYAAQKQTQQANDCFTRAIRQAESNYCQLLLNELRTESASLAGPQAKAAPPMAEAPAAPPISHTVEVRIETTTNGVQVTHDRGDNHPETNMDMGPVSRLLLQGGPYPLELVKQMSAVQSLGSELRQILRLEPGKGDLYVLIKSNEEVLSSVPWEAALNPEDYHLVHRSFSDRVSDDDTRWVKLALKTIGFKDSESGLEDFVRSRGLTPENPRQSKLLLGVEAHKNFVSENPVAVWQRRNDYEKVQRSQGWPQAQMQYRKAGVEDVLTYEPARAMSKAASVRPAAGLPSLVHIVGGFEENRTTPSLDIDPDRAINSGTMNSLLSGYPEDRLRPFVVLDVISPNDSYDRARQVFLRNLYAMQLFRYGSVRGVLAAGLAHSTEASTAIREIIVDCVARRAAIGELHHRIWQTGQTYAPPALFAVHPDLPCAW